MGAPRRTRLRRRPPTSSISSSPSSCTACSSRPAFSRRRARRAGRRRCVAPRPLPRAGTAAGRRPRRAASPPRRAVVADAAADVPAEAEAAACRPRLRRRSTARGAGSVPTSPARGPTAAATTSRRSTGPPPRGSLARAARTSSSSASTSRTRRRGSSSSATARRRCRSTRAGWPWLDEARARAARVLRLVGDSALAAQGYVGYLDHGGRPRGSRRTSQRTLRDLDLAGLSRRPPTPLARGLEELVRHRRDVPAGTFRLRRLGLPLAAARGSCGCACSGAGSTSIPVVVQDPVWEQSFPDVAGVVMPFADPASGKTVPAELTGGEVAERRRENEQRRTTLLQELRGLDLEPVLVESSDLHDVLRSFLGVGRPAQRAGRSW